MWEAGEDRVAAQRKGVEHWTQAPAMSESALRRSGASTPRCPLLSGWDARVPHPHLTGRGAAPPGDSGRAPRRTPGQHPHVTRAAPSATRPAHASTWPGTVNSSARRSRPSSAGRTLEFRIPTSQVEALRRRRAPRAPRVHGDARRVRRAARPARRAPPVRDRLIVGEPRPDRCRGRGRHLRRTCFPCGWM